LIVAWPKCHALVHDWVAWHWNTSLVVIWGSFVASPDAPHQLLRADFSTNSCEWRTHKQLWASLVMHSSVLVIVTIKQLSKFCKGAREEEKSNTAVLTSPRIFDLIFW